MESAKIGNQLDIRINENVVALVVADVTTALVVAVIIPALVGAGNVVVVVHFVIKGWWSVRCTDGSSRDGSCHV